MVTGFGKPPSLRRGLLTPHPGVCSWGPCYLRILQGSKLREIAKHTCFQVLRRASADRSGFLREGGASPAAIGTDCSPTDSGPGKKKKKPAAVSTGPVVVCCGVLQHSLAASRVSLPPACPGHVTWPYGTADLTTMVPAVPSVSRLFQVCILLAHAILPLFPPSPSPTPSFLSSSSTSISLANTISSYSL